MWLIPRRIVAAWVVVLSLSVAQLPAGAGVTWPVRYGGFRQAERGYLGCVYGVEDINFVVCVVAYAFSSHVRLVMEIKRPRDIGLPYPILESYVEDVILPPEAIVFERRPGYAPRLMLVADTPRTGHIFLEVAAPLGWIQPGPIVQTCTRTHSVHFYLDGPEIGSKTEEVGWFGGVEVRQADSSTCNAYFGLPSDAIWVFRTINEEGHLPI